MGRPPSRPKIYHIVHIDRLPSIIADGYLWCDAEVARRSSPGTTIGMDGIKRRRLDELELRSHPDLYVGDCVPFYFCPRSVMLYVLHKGTNPDLAYRGGQERIIHLEADLFQTVDWANRNQRRWAFTSSNAGAYYFDDFADLPSLSELDWEAIFANDWRGLQDGKQAEFLLERSCPWESIARIGTQSRRIYDQVLMFVRSGTHRPNVQISLDWYY